MSDLEEYRQKRNFQRTPEPPGRVRHNAGHHGGIFVVHKHAARQLHYDLRLEQDGVLRSWAIPKGPSLEVGRKRLAIEVEDHPLAYADFEGTIPEGEYGGGTVMLWDRGRWKVAGKATEDRLDVELAGSKLAGVWTLTRTRNRPSGDGTQWLLIKRSTPGGTSTAANDRSSPDIDRSVATGRTMDEIAANRAPRAAEEQGETPEPTAPDARTVPGARRSELPNEPKPQLATLVETAPAGDDWLNEIKLDGYRIMARIAAGDHEPGPDSPRGSAREVQLLTRNAQDWTARFGGVAARLARMPVETALLDGEIVAYSPDGSTSFRLLQEALRDEKTGALVYQAFDLLHLDGHDLTAAPLAERKRVLRRLLKASGVDDSSVVRYTDHVVGKAPEFVEHGCRLGLEGIVAKRGDAPYQGGRSKSWLKIKCSRHEELVIGGFTDPSGSRQGFGALLLGGYDASGALRYAGRVGTGFSADQLHELHGRLQELEISRPAFAAPPPGKGVHWVRPELVAEVEYTEWTRDRLLRHAIFRGLREDLDAEEIRMSTPADPKAPATTRSGARKRGAQKKERARAKRTDDDTHVAGIRLTNPQRVLYPEQGVTKLALARYYADIADWILPHLQDRPLSLVRCPQGRDASCFFQKHPRASLAKGVARVTIEDSEGPAPYLYVRRLEDLIELVQGGVLELHVWGSRVDDLERPDILVFDLDPATDVPWTEMLRVARELNDRLGDLGLAGFPRTTGGKGLHVVTPIVPELTWDEAKAFAKSVAEAHARDDARRITTNMSKAQRRGKIFLDYLRNGRGATAIASYSTRSRPGAPVAVPVRWDELNRALTPDRYSIENLRRRLAALRADPWEEFTGARRPVTGEMLAAVQGA